ncbi:MAG: hypothetical protein HY423_12120 [Candidatus Lambdaproteobacteria bacterium]|nr:hypothetical protein [Candidatus Lambdaproteobacteria bacterium]
MGMRRLIAAAVVLAGMAAGVLPLGAALAQETARRGGIVGYWDYSDPARLDWMIESALSNQQATAGVYSGLLQYDPDDPEQIVPDLATGYTADADGLGFAFTLRQGVKWHDGRPFSTADVKASFDRMLDPKVKSPRCGALLKDIVAKVQYPDDQTVHFRLKFPAATFLPSIASAWCRIAAKHVLERDGDLQSAKSQIGTGPFKFKRYERGSIIEWERNPDYYDPRYPLVDGVRQYILTAPARQMAAAKTGQIDLWYPYPPMTKTQADELRKVRGDQVDIIEWPVNNVWVVFLNTTKPPFDNVDLRRAVHLALDRQELFAKIFEGVGLPCAILDVKTDGAFALPPEEVNATPGCRRPKDQDIAEARRLVARHYPQGLDMDVLAFAYSNQTARAELVVSQLRKANIRGKIRSLEYGGAYSAIGRGDFQMIGSLNTANFVKDPNGLVSQLYISKGGRNFGKWKSERFDKLADAGVREIDTAKRIQIYYEMQRMLLNEDPSGVVMLGREYGYYFRDKRLRNYHFAPVMYDNLTFMKSWLTK